MKKQKSNTPQSSLLTPLLLLLQTLLFASLLAAPASAQVPFNLEIELPETYETVPAGENLWFTTKLINLANPKRIDVTLKYEILDANRELKSTRSETVAVETQASFVSRIKLPKNLESGIHILKVTLYSPYGKSESETSFEVAEEEPKAWIVIRLSLFDITVEIPDKYKKIHAGDELLTSIKLMNLGSGGRVDVFLDYWITDPGGNTILKKKETVAVETQANFVRTFDIPENVKPGTYHIYAKITYADGKLAVADHSFEIIESQRDKQIYYGLAIMAILATTALLTLLATGSKPTIRKLQIKAEVYKIVTKKLNK